MPSNLYSKIFKKTALVLHLFFNCPVIVSLPSNSKKNWNSLKGYDF